MGLNIVAWHGKLLSDHMQLVETWAAEGYRTKSLSIYGDPSAPLYAAVMILRPDVIAERAWYTLNVSDFQQIFSEQAADGFGPAILSATGPADDPLIAASFVQMSPAPLTRYGLTAADLAALNTQAFQNDLVLRWADAYGTTDDTRYIAVWWPNPVEDDATAQTAWQNDGVADDEASEQARFGAATAGGGRPVHIALDPAQRVLEIYADTEVGAWVSRAGLTSEQYQAEFDAQAQDDLWPVCVSGSGSGDGVRYAAIFAEDEDLAPRLFRSSGPDGMSDVPGIDAAIETLLKANDTRGAALAIVDGVRLVYAKGYTWAEADYPDIQPTTYFRQASVSKTFTALAVYQLLEEGATCPDGSTFSLDTSLQTILQFDSPADPRFNDITIRHLLEMTSSVTDVWGSGDIDAVGGAGNLPASESDLARYAATLMLGPNPPGDTTNAQYNNTGYILLGLVVAALRGATDLVAAIMAPLLAPLEITRVRLSSSLLAAQSSDEAFYHPRMPVSGSQRTTQIQAGASLMTPDQPLVPFVYGYPSVENCVGSGGISAAVTDVARLIATFSIPGDSPVLTAESRSTMLQNAANATATYTGPSMHGYHGFDSVTETDPANGYYSGNKGGYLYTSQNIYSFQMGGLSYVLCVNGNLPNDPGNWFGSVQATAVDEDWGNTDLFPTYGMSSFAPPPPPPPPPHYHRTRPRRPRSESVIQPHHEPRPSAIPAHDLSARELFPARATFDRLATRFRVPKAAKERS